ncbi:MAG: YkgJ family cysteine cluster protein [bacterium]
MRKHSDESGASMMGDSKAPCMKMLEFCHGDCCRQGGVMLNPDEIASGLYETEVFCIRQKKPCEKTQDCYLKITQLKMNENGCMYIGADNRCSIYDHRPSICRRYNCRGGREFFGTEHDWMSSRIRSDDRDLLRFSAKLIFAPNQLVKMKAVVPEPDKEKLFLLLRDSEMCEDTMYAGDMPWPGCDEKTVFEIFGKFDGVKTLGAIETETAQLFPDVADKKEIESRVRRLLVMWERQRLVVPVHS